MLFFFGRGSFRHDYYSDTICEGDCSYSVYQRLSTKFDQSRVLSRVILHASIRIFHPNQCSKTYDQSHPRQLFYEFQTAIYFSWFGPELFRLLLGPPGFNCWFSSAPVFQWCCSTPQGSPGVGRNTFLSSPHLCFIIVFICDLFVSRDDPLMS